jgi:hypothetical protein
MLLCDEILSALQTAVYGTLVLVGSEANLMACSKTFRRSADADHNRLPRNHCNFGLE